jgi:RNA polymerase sigma-70 factor (ECF subfamily)
MPDGPGGERDFAERTAGSGPSPEDQLLSRERRAALGRALAKLPERQRSVFMLSHYEGCTSREVSALTGLNESTVRVHLFRAIRKLRTLLGNNAGAGVPVEKRRVHP